MKSLSIKFLDDVRTYFKKSVRHIQHPQYLFIEIFEKNETDIIRRFLSYDEIFEVFDNHLNIHGFVTYSFTTQSWTYSIYNKDGYYLSSGKIKDVPIYNRKKAKTELFFAMLNELDYDN